MEVSMKECRRAETARNRENGGKVCLCLHWERKRRDERVLMFTTTRSFNGEQIGSINREGRNTTRTGTAGRGIAQRGHLVGLHDE